MTLKLVPIDPVQAIASQFAVALAGLQFCPGLIPRCLRRNVKSGFSGYLAACGEVVHYAYPITGIV